MTDWHTFYTCVQDPLYWNRFHCIETLYSELPYSHITKDGKIVNTKLVAVPFVVPKILHKKYIEFQMMPRVTLEEPSKNEGTHSVAK